LAYNKEQQDKKMVSDKDKKDSIFRKESLERLSSPERLDLVMKVSSSKDWLALAFFGGLTVAGLIWSFVGRIPVTVEGRAVFIQPRQVVEFQSSIAGQLKSLNVSAGQCVKKDQVLATVDPVGLREQLRLAQQKLGQLQRQAQDSLSLSAQRMQLETSALAAVRINLEQRLRDAQALAPLMKEKSLYAISQQRISLQQRLNDTESLAPGLKEKELKAINQQRISLLQRLEEAQAFAPALKEKGLTAIAQQRIGLQQRLKDAQNLVPVLEQKLEKRKTLVAAGAIAADEILSAEQEYRQGLQSISQLQTELKQLDLTETQTQQSHQQNLNTIGELNAQLQQLDSQIAKTEREYLTDLRSIKEIQAQLRELDVQIAKTEREYLDNLRSISDIQGQIQELDSKAKRLEQENLEASNQRTKEIQEVNREIIRTQQQIKENSQIVSTQEGCILELTTTIGQVVQPGSRLGAMRVGNSEESMNAIAFFTIKDGKKLQKKMPVSITPETVQRERYGGIVGQITIVSPLPVTREGIVAIIGNTDLVRAVMSENSAFIQVNTELEKDPTTDSGYKWSSSKGPKSKITSGTTATVRVTVEERAPITFVLPILRELSGMP
jgi:HlyD family secretion protein